MTDDQIRALLYEHSEEKYKKFSLPLLSCVKEENFLGVRIPYLRLLAKEICKGQPEEFLDGFPEKFFEDVMLKGFVTAFADFSWDERLRRIREHTEKIDNWSLCDSFVSSLKFINSSRREFLSFLQPYFESSREFEARFSLVCLLHYYNTAERAEENLNIIKASGCQKYYALTAKAWALAEICTVCEDGVYSFLKSKSTDLFTHNKAISKICDSRKISNEYKVKVSILRR